MLNLVEIQACPNAAYSYNFVFQTGKEGFQFVMNFIYSVICHGPMPLTINISIYL